LLTRRLFSHLALSTRLSDQTFLFGMLRSFNPLAFVRLPFDIGLNFSSSPLRSKALAFGLGCALLRGLTVGFGLHHQPLMLDTPCSFVCGLRRRLKPSFQALCGKALTPSLLSGFAFGKRLCDRTRVLGTLRRRQVFGLRKLGGESRDFSMGSGGLFFGKTLTLSLCRNLLLCNLGRLQLDHCAGPPADVFDISDVLHVPARPDPSLRCRRVLHGVGNGLDIGELAGLQARQRDRQV